MHLAKFIFNSTSLIFILPTLVVYLIINLFVRLIYVGLYPEEMIISILHSFRSISITAFLLNLLELFSAFCIGFLSDIIAGVYIFLPIIFISTIITLFKRPPIIRHTLMVVNFIFLCFVIFTAIGEVLFLEEFGRRFDYIAVDYLKHPLEIIGMVIESYNMFLILLSVALLALLLTFVTRHLLQYALTSMRHSRGLQFSCFSFFILLLLPIFSTMFSFDHRINYYHNEFLNQLATNGVYSFFYSYRAKDISYRKSYPTLANSDVIQNMKNVYKERLITREFPLLIRRDETGELSSSWFVKKESEQKRYNVVLISVESLSASFLAYFGNTKKITPFLDSLIKDSVFFENIYATGTRTVRGLETLALGLPPTPGPSRVKDNAHENLLTIGKVFSRYKYDVRFIYGGFSYFDNMDNFFTKNHYRVLDRKEFMSNEIGYANIWGIADEDVMMKAISLADMTTQKGHNFFHHILTLSNHRPYSYPNKKIDMSAASGRDGAVKYSDYALMQFMKEAQKRSWFDNTIFVITADHGHSSVGSSLISLAQFHIPLIIYAPKILKPAILKKVGSQLDIPATILSLMKWSESNQFIGRNLFADLNDQPLFLASYDTLGYVNRGKMFLMSNDGRELYYDITFYPKIKQKLRGEKDSSLKNEAISFYQYADDIYSRGDYK